jgi:hypothetical protein
VTIYTPISKETPLPESLPVFVAVKEAEEEDNYSETFSDKKEKPVLAQIEQQKPQSKPKVFMKPNFGLKK